MHTCASLLVPEVHVHRSTGEGQYRNWGWIPWQRDSENVWKMQCITLVNTQCFIKGVMIFTMEVSPDARKIRSSLSCPKLEIKNPGVALCTKPAASVCKGRL